MFASALPATTCRDGVSKKVSMTIVSRVFFRAEEEDSSPEESNETNIYIHSPLREIAISWCAESAKIRLAMESYAPLAWHSRDSRSTVLAANNFIALFVQLFGAYRSKFILARNWVLINAC